MIWVWIALATIAWLACTAVCCWLECSDSGSVTLGDMLIFLILGPIIMAYIVVYIFCKIASKKFAPILQTQVIKCPKTPSP